MAKQESKSDERSFHDVVNKPENVTIKNVTENTERNPLDEPEEFPIVFRAGRDEITLLNNLTATPPPIIHKLSNQARLRTPKKEKKYKHTMKTKTSFKKHNHRSRNKKIERNVCSITNEKNSKSIFEIVSLCQILKRVSAKESLLDDLNFGREYKNENDEDITISICSKESVIGNSRDNTVTLMSANESFENNNHVTDSVVFIVDEPIKPNIISVSRVQVDNLTFHNRKSTPVSSCDSLLDNQDAASNTNTIVGLNGLTSDPNSNETLAHSSDQGAFFTSSEASVGTLTADNEKQQAFVERDIDESSLNSLSQSSMILAMEKSDNSSSDNGPNSSLSYDKQKLMHTVIDLGMFPEMTERSRPLNNYNDVIVAGSLLTKFTPLVKDDKGKDDENNDSNTIPMKNVVQKSPIPPTISDIKPKCVKLPNEGTLNDLLKLNEKYEPDKVKVEWQSDYPSNITELWETMIAALNTRVQKLEKSLTDKILTEMKISLNVLDKLRQLAEENVTLNTEKLNKSFYRHDRDLQCDLLEPLKSCTTATETGLSNTFLTDSKEVQYNLEPSFEVLKPVLRAAGDSEDIMTGVSVEVKPATFVATRTKFFKSRFSFVDFVKDNAVVLIATPIFIAMLICIYFLINTIVNSL